MTYYTHAVLLVATIGKVLFVGAGATVVVFVIVYAIHVAATLRASDRSLLVPKMQRV
jgi:hypothetical protein